MCGALTRHAKGGKQAHENRTQRDAPSPELLNRNFALHLQRNGRGAYLLFPQQGTDSALRGSACPSALPGFGALGRAASGFDAG